MWQEMRHLSLTAEEWHRIGAQLRRRRIDRAITIKSLADRLHVPARKIERLESGEGIEPSDALVDVARCLGFELPELLRTPADPLPEPELFSDVLEQIAIPRENWDEFSQLSPVARDALVRALERHNGARLERSRRLAELAELIREVGVAEALPFIATAIRQYGSGPLDFTRALVWMEEIPGPRLQLTDRVPMVPLAHGIDQMQRFRAVFGVDLTDPQLMTWWARARRTALLDSLRREESRIVLPWRQLERYARTGDRAPHLTFSREIVQEHVEVLIGLLRGNPRFRIGLIDSLPRVGFRMRQDQLLLHRTGDLTLRPGSNGIMLRFNEPDIVARFRDYFEELWNAIPDKQKDPEVIADRLEQLVIKSDN